MSTTSFEERFKNAFNRAYLTQKIKDSASGIVEKRLIKLQDKLNNAPMLRLKDKLSFMVGISLLVGTEYMTLSFPQYLPMLYSGLLILLLTIRFFMYHKTNMHYFMLDFCYYTQVWALLSIYIWPSDLSTFKIFFGMSNGPLLASVITWKNKMVFHDIDKITSLFIHLMPPLVSFCMRWFPIGNIFDTDDALNITLRDFSHIIMFYVLWQFLYLVKTELIDHKRLSEDQSLMTSLRWWTLVQPHPVFKAVKNKGWNISGIVLLTVSQLLYTIVTLLPIFFMWNYKWVHSVSLLIAFGFATWGGASFYFEVFTEKYAKRLEAKIKKINNDADGYHKEEEKKKYKYFPNSFKSVKIFILYFSFGLFMITLLMNYVVWNNV